MYDLARVVAFVAVAVIAMVMISAAVVDGSRAMSAELRSDEWQLRSAEIQRERIREHGALGAHVHGDRGTHTDAK